MTDSGTTSTSYSPIEAVFASELARGDLVLGTVGPMLGMLLASHDSALFTDEVVAGVRGMGLHVARQMLTAQAKAAGVEEPCVFAVEHADALAEALTANLQFLGHCHVLALEHRLSTHLERSNAIDPVLSPLLQSLTGAPDAETAQLARAALGAQARFIEQQRRTELPLGELPPSLFEQALFLWSSRATGAERSVVEEAVEHLREAYDPQARRVSLLERVAGMTGEGPRSMLSVEHAGVALFLSALALATSQDRDLIALATNQSQVGRLALALRGAGLSPEQIAKQFALVHPGVLLPEGLDSLPSGRAAALLAASDRQVLG